MNIGTLSKDIYKKKLASGFQPTKNDIGNYSMKHFEVICLQFANSR
jgi:hypothetical protein